ncbi:MAG: 50S ribosomal protein L31 [Anaerolineales bacterium]|nr:50S ribosomal protein L31 [Anaerolineales bacterium]
MKKDTHPEWYPEAKVIYEGEVVMTVGATQPEIRVDIWSQVHPFYTGQSRLLDTEGQVDRFLRRLRKREEIQTEREQSETESKRDPRALAVDSMSLGSRAENALEEAGLTTVGDVLEKLQESEDALLSLPGIGQKALIDIKRFLRAEDLIE